MAVFFFVNLLSIYAQCVFVPIRLQWTCKVVSELTRYLSSESRIPEYMSFPKFLLGMTSLSETAKIIYTVLLGRARLSQKKTGWADDYGHIFIYYPIKDLAAAVHKSDMTVKSALSALEKEQLIHRQHMGLGKANRIYVKLPLSEERNLSVREKENCPSDGKNPVCQKERKLSTSNNENSNNNRANRMSKAYGQYQNVFLSDDDIASLRQDISNYQEYIERLSRYMHSTHKKYDDHAATIRRWYSNDNPTPPARKYVQKASESL